jgi:hypothetical protein
MFWICMLLHDPDSLPSDRMPHGLMILFERLRQRKGAMKGNIDLLVLKLINRFLETIVTAIIVV